MVWALALFASDALFLVENSWPALQRFSCQPAIFPSAL
jgi:hypothetical protein